MPVLKLLCTPFAVFNNGAGPFFEQISVYAMLHNDSGIIFFVRKNGFYCIDLVLKESMLIYEQHNI